MIKSTITENKKNVKIPVESHCEGGDVIVTFEDGIRAIFTPYTHGMGYQIEGLERFVLLHDDKILCKINSRLYRCGPQEDEHKVVILSPDVTLKDVAEYWDEAKSFVAGKFYPKGRDGENYKVTNQDFWYEWRVTTEGYFDLQRLKEGKMEILPSKDNKR